MRIIEVVCRDNAPDANTGGNMMAKRYNMGAGYSFEETDLGVIIRHKRAIFVPWANILGCILDEAASPKKASKAQATA